MRKGKKRSEWFCADPTHEQQIVWNKKPLHDSTNINEI
jgi:hypothetical protein